MKKLLLTVFTILLLHSAFSQNTAWYVDEDAAFKQAKELYDKEKYNTAQKLFFDVYEKHKDEQTLIKSLSQFYIAQCAVRLFNADAEYYSVKFIEENPNSPLVNDAYFSLGGYFYTIKRWDDALKSYEKTNWRKLSQDEQSEYFFKKGYCYFSKDDEESAKTSFYEIIDRNTKFTAPALYYYSHIHYTQKNYQTALNGFIKLTGDKTFGPIVPYYVVQIYYMQGKYQEIVDFVPGIISNVTEQRLDEVARIAAEAYFKLERYEESIQFFEKYMAAVSTPATDAVYQMAYAYYKTNQYDKAAEKFEKISHEEGAIGQNASYYLASCYLQKGDKENARKAFASASRSDFDPVIKQDAMFNYALLTFEVGGDPFNDAIKAFEDFIEQYPGSKRIDEARRMLIQAYLGARNYKKALASIDKIENKNDELKEAYQRIAYNRGVELFNNLDFVQASEMFRNALKYKGFDAQREAKAAFWLGESLYRQKLYDEAITSFKTFKTAPVSNTTDEFKIVDYDLAYAYYKKENYAEAANSFRQFSSSNTAGMSSSYLADAYLRIGDCYFMQTNYIPSADFYQKAIDAQIENKDYALMQKGLCLGLLKKELDKIATLKLITQGYPTSVYADNAYYEIAQEYLKLQDSQQAIDALTTMYSKYPQSELAGKALVQLGLLYFNSDNNDAAIKYYKLAVTNYSGTEEARDALFGLKNIYIDLGKVDDYSAFVDGMQGNVPRLSVNEKDSLTYVAAEKLYMASNCAEAKTAFARYISAYPNGSYLKNAYFYKGDCHYQALEYTDAQAMFDYVIKQPRNTFTEQAYLGNSRISVSLKDNNKIIENYSGLLENSSSPSSIKEAKFGIMRAQFALERNSEALQTAEEILNLTGLTEENQREANFIKARCLQLTGRDVLALDAYRQLSKEVLSPQGAESKFRIAEILFAQNKLDESEKEVLEFSGRSTSHDYWVARSFILWSDIFVARKNYFQAIETLQSIIDYYATFNDGILDMARSKKDAVEKLSKETKTESGQEPVEVNIESKN